MLLASRARLCAGLAKATLRPQSKQRHLSPLQLLRHESSASSDDDEEVAAATKRGRVPRRAMMYLPGHDQRKINLAAKIDLDTVCLDIEDAVAPARKADARQQIIEALQTVDFGRSEVAVRINPVSSEFWKDDLRALLLAPKLPDTIVVPKVESFAQLDLLFSLAERLEDERKEDIRIGMLTQVESAKGLLNLQSICEMDQDIDTESLILEHRGLIFGSDDFAASIGATRSKDNKELLYARQAVVVHAKAYNLDCIDLVNINFKDLEQLEKEALEGYAWGFTGKQVIHPAQVPVVQKAFSPTEQEVARAQAIVSAFQEHEAQGTGAFNFNGQMIDMPTILQCQHVLHLNKLATSTSQADEPRAGDAKDAKEGAADKNAEQPEDNKENSDADANSKKHESK